VRPSCSDAQTIGDDFTKADGRRRGDLGQVDAKLQRREDPERNRAIYPDRPAFVGHARCGLLEESSGEAVSELLLRMERLRADDARQSESKREGV
jgi:hypothetical protein